MSLFMPIQPSLAHYSTVNLKAALTS